MKLLLYCTKSKPYLYDDTYEKFKKVCLMTDTKREYTEITSPYWLTTNRNMGYGSLNGTIPCECDYEVEEIHLQEYDDYNYSCYSKMYYETITLSEEELCKHSCLTPDELDNYLYNKGSYAIHIKNLHIFNEPKELKNLLKIISKIGFPTIICDYCQLGINKNCVDCSDYYYTEELTKAPQNMMYVFDGNEKKVLISIHPENLCKILNGEKTIEVRKKVLKCMKKKVN